MANTWLIHRDSCAINECGYGENAIYVSFLRQKQSVNFKINIIQKKVNENNETYQKKCIFAALYFIVCQNRRK